MDMSDLYRIAWGQLKNVISNSYNLAAKLTYFNRLWKTTFEFLRNWQTAAYCETICYAFIIWVIDNFYVSQLVYLQL